MKQIFTLLFLLLTTLFVNAQTTYTLTDADVVVSNGVIESCSYDFAIKDIIIPDVLDGQAVTGIDDGYDYGKNFFRDKGITSVQLPSTLQVIGNYAFRSNSLTRITIPNSVTSIGDYAFSQNSLYGITIPNSVTSIGERAFSHNSLSDITIYYSVTSIGKGAFNNNWITMYNGTASNGIIYARNTDGSEDYTTIVSYGGYGDIIIDFIPNTVTSIGEAAFYNTFLINVTIPNSVTSIGNWAFAYTGLTNVTIPNSVTFIGNYAFYNNSLTSITIPNTVISIGEMAFNSNSLNDVTFEANSNILSIEKNAFADNRLTFITWPTHAATSFIDYKNGDGDTYSPGHMIKYFATNYYTNAPYTLTDADVVVTNGIIESCSYNVASKVIIIPKTLDGQTIMRIGDDYKNLFNGKGIASVQLPSMLQTIGNAAFINNNLTGIIIPNSVTSIGEYAFAGNSLTSVIFEANSNILAIEENAFVSNTGLTSITLPTHAATSFIDYKDGNGNMYSPGNAITDFATNYYTNAPYTLTDADVVVTNGIIESCSYNVALKVIIIPETLDGQPVTGIGDDYQNLFYRKGIAYVQLPSTLQTIGFAAFEDNNLTSALINN